MLSLGRRGKSNGCTAAARVMLLATWRMRRLCVSLPINKNENSAGGSDEIGMDRRRRDCRYDRQHGDSPHGGNQAGRAVLDGLPAVQRHEARQADREICHPTRPEGLQGLLAALQRSGGDERSAAVEFDRHRQRRGARPDHAVGQDARHVIRGQGNLRAQLAAVPAQHRQSRHQVHQGFRRARPHRGALDQGVGAGGAAADGGSGGLWR